MNTFAKKTIACAAIVAGLATLSTPMAAEQGESQKQHRKGPPAEAFEACANLSEQAACSFTSPRGEAKGQCVIPRQADNTQLVCKPESMGKHKKKSQQEG